MSTLLARDARHPGHNEMEIRDLRKIDKIPNSEVAGLRRGLMRQFN